MRNADMIVVINEGIIEEKGKTSIYNGAFTLAKKIVNDSEVC
jgi:hypothetical protein